jgi:hypothetical protein
MKLTSLTLSDLKKIQNLLSRKEKLNKQVLTVDRMLERFESGATPASAKAGPRRKARRRGAPPGQLKSRIIDALKSAGTAGMHIKEVAAKVKNKPGNIRTWFFTTGKKIRNIKKAGPARYRWQS